jgi:hypothetical protein
MHLTIDLRHHIRFTALRAPERVLAVCLGTLLSANAAVASEPAGSSGGTAQLTFDIPSQPLAAALEQYGDVTGWEVLYNGDLAAGRLSEAVRGAFAPDAALRVLLKGTSLSARHTSDVSIMLVPADVPRVTKAPASPADRDYYGEIQQGIETALCANMKAHPGDYRVAARFWIDATCALQQYRRLGSSGNSNTDSAIDATMRGLKFGDPPPPGFVQPITIAVVPQVPGVTPGCASGQGDDPAEADQ